MKPLFTLALVGLTALGVYWGSQWAASELTQTADQGVVEMSLVEMNVAANCDLRSEACSASSEAGQLNIHFVDGLSATQGSKVWLQLLNMGDDVAKVTMELQGKTMFMGVNHYPLVQQADGWHGTLVIPVCTTQKMTWLLDVWLQHTDQSVQRARFEFEMEH